MVGNVSEADDVLADPESVAEQPVVVEHPSVMVDVVAVVLPSGVKIDIDVSQALTVRAEQDDEVLGEEDEDFLSSVLDFLFELLLFSSSFSSSPSS